MKYFGSNTKRAVRIARGKMLIQEQIYAQQERMREQMAEHLGDGLSGWPKKVTDYLYEQGVRFGGAQSPFESHEEHLQDILQKNPEIGAYLYSIAHAIHEASTLRVMGLLTIRTPLRCLVVRSKRLRLKIIIHTPSSTTVADELSLKVNEIISLQGERAEKAVDLDIAVSEEPMHSMIETILQKQLTGEVVGEDAEVINLEEVS
jgi:hypothetical protein